MRFVRGAVVLLLIAVTIGCTQTAAPSGSPSASGSAAASASGAGKPVNLRVVVPTDGARAGIKGAGWSVDVLAKANDGSVLGDFRPGLSTTPRIGHSVNFPGLVVLLSSATAAGQTRASASPSASASASAAASASAPPPSATTVAGGGAPNLAGLFQLFAITDQPGENAAARASASATPSASPSASATASQAAARGTVSTGPREVEATWVVTDARFGADIDVELTAFVVEGTAPDTVADRSSLRIISNEVTVRFHINDGAGAGGATPAPSGSASPPASPSASPSGSASPSASKSP